MKYMNFLSSCSYAGLANLLERVGVDTEDVRIAVALRLPWLLEREGKDRETKNEQKIEQEMEQEVEIYSYGTYHAGAMLQGGVWFNRYLKPRGWRFVETACGREEAVAALAPGSMLGLRVSEQSKHAVIFEEKRGNIFVFLNNRKKEGKEPEYLMFTGEECLERLDDTVWVGKIEPCEREKVDFVPLLEVSLENWGKWWEEFAEFAARRQEWDALCAARDAMFRAFLLDGLAVCGLIAGEGQGNGGDLARRQEDEGSLAGQQEDEGILAGWQEDKGSLAGRQEDERILARQQEERLTSLQRQYLEVMRRREAVVLAQEMDMDLAHRAVLGYQEMIQARIEVERGGSLAKDLEW